MIIRRRHLLEEEQEEESCVSEYSADCCTTAPYEKAFRILNVVAVTMCLSQMSVPVEIALSWSLATVPALQIPLLLIGDGLWSMIAILLTVFGSFAYQHVAYSEFMCGRDGDFCVHRPGFYPVMYDVFLCLIVVGCVRLAIDVAHVIASMYVSLTVHQPSYGAVRSDGDVISMFRGGGEQKENHDISELFGGRRSRSSSSLGEEVEDRRPRVIVRKGEEEEEERGRRRQAMMSAPREWSFPRFVEFWSSVADETIMDDLPEHAEHVLHVLSCGGSGQQKEKKVSYEDFRRFAAANMVVDETRVWRMLSARGTAGIDALTVREALYDVYFKRRLVAKRIRTDAKLFSYVTLLVSAFVYPICFIVASKIFGYANAFGEGIDLFKSYVAVASFVFSRISDNLRFLGTMLSDRHFDLGEVLHREDTDALFEVVDFNMFFTKLRGACGASVTVDNAMIVNGTFRNLTRAYGGSTDTMDLTFPFPSEKGDEEKRADELLDKYDAVHPLTLADPWRGGVRSRWTRANDDGKTLRCTWGYRFRIASRIRLHEARTSVRNWLVRHLGKKED